jgi:hypothetical protein
MPRCGATFDEKRLLFGQGGTSGGLGVGFRSAFPNPSRQPPEGFTTAVVSPSFPPFLLRGNFREPESLGRIGFLSRSLLPNLSNQSRNNLV